jgi:uncharacterized protein YraI
MACKSVGEHPRPCWKSITLSASLLAATASAAAASVTVRTDVALRAGPEADFSAIGHVPGGTELEATDCTGGWCPVEFNGIAGFVGAADLVNGAIRSPSARRVEKRQRSHTRVTGRSAHAGSATRSAPAGEDADLFVLPAQAPHLG